MLHIFSVITHYYYYIYIFCAVLFAGQSGKIATVSKMH